MRIASLFLLSLLAAGCVSQDEAMRQQLEKQYAVKYYDRNHDGIVDLEFHDIPGAMDAAWALIDTKFKGRYDLRDQWSVALTQERVDIPVPRNVHITPGKPPVNSRDLRFWKRPNQAMQRTAR
jgi:hypothetical protein